MVETYFGADGPPGRGSQSRNCKQVLDLVRFLVYDELELRIREGMTEDEFGTKKLAVGRGRSHFPHLDFGLFRLEVQQVREIILVDIRIKLLFLFAIDLLQVAIDQKLLRTFQQLLHNLQKLQPNYQQYLGPIMRLIFGHIERQCILDQHLEIIFHELICISIVGAIRGLLSHLVDAQRI